MTLPIFNDVVLQHLDQVGRETDAAVREGLIGERDAVWIQNMLWLVRVDVIRAVGRAGQPVTATAGREDGSAVPPRSLGSEDTLVLPGGDGP